MKYCAFNPERPCDSDCGAFLQLEHEAEDKTIEVSCARMNKIMIWDKPQESKESFVHHRYTTSVFKKGSSDET